MYAQTSIQLFNQLYGEGYSNKEIVSIREAYQLAVWLFSGLIRPSGKTYIDHAVGTASVLVSLHASALLVSAGILHAAYTHGDFGTGKYDMSDGKREQIKRAVGERVEDYVARYTALQWDQETITIMHDTLDRLDAMDREVLLMRLANTLEDHLDLGVLYCSNAETRQWSASEQRGPILVDIASKLGFPGLSEELERVFRETAPRKIRAEFCFSNQHHAYLIVPKSYRKKLWITLRQRVLSKGHSFDSSCLNRKHGRLRQLISHQG